jgi:hypothetical protein
VLAPLMVRPAGGSHRSARKYRAAHRQKTVCGCLQPTLKSAQKLRSGFLRDFVWLGACCSTCNTQTGRTSEASTSSQLANHVSYASQKYLSELSAACNVQAHALCCGFLGSCSLGQAQQEFVAYMRSTTTAEASCWKTAIYHKGFLRLATGRRGPLPVANHLAVLAVTPSRELCTPSWHASNAMFARCLASLQQVRG